MTDFTTTFLSSHSRNHGVLRTWLYRFHLNLLTGCLLAGIAGAPSVSWAEEAKSDIRSLHRLFGAELSNNAFEIRSRSRKMPPTERYEYLSQKVLPRETNEIRIAIDFIPTNPSPPVLEKYGSVDLPLPKTASKRRIPSGGALVSPAIDLVELAQRLGKLGELKAEISRRSPVESEGIKSRSALLILIAATEGEIEQYGSLLNKFFTLVRESPVTDVERAPEMVVVWRGAQAEETRFVVRDLLLFLRVQMQNPQHRHRESINRHIFSLDHLLDEQLVRQNPAFPDRTAKELEHWHIASGTKAVTRGNGYPNAAWMTSPGRVRHLSGHDFDYLYFASPLRGDFEIEAELNSFGGNRTTRLAVGTIWMGPIYGRTVVNRGWFRGMRPGIKVDPPFSKFGPLMRVREVVRDGLRSTFINGREVLTQPHGTPNDPWIAAFSPSHSSGEVRNLRITGNPEIPDEIDLIADPELSGWLPYFVSWNTSGWSLEQPQSPSERLNPFRNELSSVLVGQMNRSLAGQFQESLLRYHRPMVEDGTIEYEFYCKEGEFGVFPALDRCCFLFDSKRAGIHWLTDGEFDRTGLDPANFFLSQNVPSIPLIENDWNQLRLTLKGDTVEIALNGTSILTRKLEAFNLRTFGLFHYSGRTEARVRNLRWRGEWPKKLPAPREQELADYSLEDELANGPELRTVFEHEFSEGLPQDKIWIAGRNWQESTEERPDGLWMKRPGGSYDLYEKNTLSLPFGLKGDFDITWEFEDFQAEIVENGNGNVHVLLLFDDDDSTECRLFRLFRKLGFPDKGDHEQLVQTAIFHTPPDGQKRFTHPANVAEHSAGGKLRLVRRGNTLYFLSAENHSDYFRLVYQSDVTAAPISLGGIKGIIETHREGETSTLWKRITVNAESIPAVLESQKFTLEQLDRQRSQLQKSLSIDLNRETDSKRIAIGGDPTRVSRENEGWLIRQPGFDNWQGTEIRPVVDLKGDFDVALELDVLKLEQSKTGSKSTVYLHVGFDKPRPLGIELKYSKDAGSPRSLEIRVTTSGQGGELRYNELKHLKADRVTQLRIARRGPIAYLIARQSETDKAEIVGRIEVGTGDLSPNSLRALVHTGGAGQETIVRFKSLRIHAEQFK